MRFNIHTKGSKEALEHSGLLNDMGCNEGQTSCTYSELPDNAGNLIEVSIPNESFAQPGNKLKAFAQNLRQRAIASFLFDPDGIPATPDGSWLAPEESQDIAHLNLKDLYKVFGNKDYNGSYVLMSAAQYNNLLNLTEAAANYQPSAWTGFNTKAIMGSLSVDVNVKSLAGLSDALKKSADQLVDLAKSIKVPTEGAKPSVDIKPTAFKNPLTITVQNPFDSLAKVGDAMVDFSKYLANKSKTPVPQAPAPTAEAPASVKQPEVDASVQPDVPQPAALESINHEPVAAAPTSTAASDQSVNVNGDITASKSDSNLGVVIISSLAGATILGLAAYIYKLTARVKNLQAELTSDKAAREQTLLEANNIKVQAEAAQAAAEQYKIKAEAALGEIRNAIKNLQDELTKNAQAKAELTQLINDFKAQVAAEKRRLDDHAKGLAVDNDKKLQASLDKLLAKVAELANEKFEELHKDLQRIVAQAESERKDASLKYQTIAKDFDDLQKEVEEFKEFHSDFKELLAGLTTQIEDLTAKTDNVGEAARQAHAAIDALRNINDQLDRAFHSVELLSNLVNIQARYIRDSSQPRNLLDLADELIAVDGQIRLIGADLTDAAAAVAQLDTPPAVVSAPPVGEESAAQPSALVVAEPAVAAVVSSSESLSDLPPPITVNGDNLNLGQGEGADEVVYVVDPSYIVADDPAIKVDSPVPPPVPVAAKQVPPPLPVAAKQMQAAQPVVAATDLKPLSIIMNGPASISERDLFVSVYRDMLVWNPTLNGLFYDTKNGIEGGGYSYEALAEVVAKNIFAGKVTADEIQRALTASRLNLNTPQSRSIVLVDLVLYKDAYLDKITHSNKMKGDKSLDDALGRMTKRQILDQLATLLMDPNSSNTVNAPRNEKLAEYNKRYNEAIKANTTYRDYMANYLPTEHATLMRQLGADYHQSPEANLEAIKQGLANAQGGWCAEMKAFVAALEEKAPGFMARYEHLGLNKAAVVLKGLDVYLQNRGTSTHIDTPLIEAEWVLHGDNLNTSDKYHSKNVLNYFTALPTDWDLSAMTLDDVRAKAIAEGYPRFVQVLDDVQAQLAARNELNGLLPDQLSKMTMTVLKAVLPEAGTEDLHLEKQYKAYVTAKVEKLVALHVEHTQSGSTDSDRFHAEYLRRTEAEREARRAAGHGRR